MASLEIVNGQHVVPIGILNSVDYGTCGVFPGRVLLINGNFTALLNNM